MTVQPSSGVRITHHPSRITADVLVLGAGPAGAATAIALVRAGVSVLIAERGDGGREPVGESLPPSVRPLLARLGVDEAFLATEPRPCYANRSAWGDGALRDHDFIRDPHGHGWHIDRGRFDGMLVEAAAGAGACVLRGARLAGVERAMTQPPVGETQALPIVLMEHNRRATRPRAQQAAPLPTDSTPHKQSDDVRWRVALTGATGDMGVNARFVVDASGRAAAFARLQGAGRRRVDRLVAAVAVLDGGVPSVVDSTTLVEAAPDGWWYSAPLPDGRMVAAFMTDPDLLVRARGGTADGWRRLLAASEHTRLRAGGRGEARPVVPRVVAAGSGRLDRTANDGWLAVGDAAMSFDPLASHGIGAALDGGLRAAAAIRAWLAGDRDAPAVYAAHQAKSFARYLWMWRAYYGEERRWPDAPFWRRRHAAVESRLPRSVRVDP